MKYGYAVIASEGHGEMWWDEYYETPVVKKIRLFKTKKERDNGVKNEEAKLRREGHSYNEICKFITKG